ncbi:MAG: hypothetical protein ACXWDJ_12650 [Aeromicrobium sp.]
MQRVQRVIAGVIVTLLGAVGCTGAAAPGTSTSSAATGNPSSPSTTERSAEAVAAACTLVDATDAFDPPLALLLSAWDRGDPEDLAEGTTEMKDKVDEFVDLHSKLHGKLPANLRADFASAASDAARDAEAIVRLKEGVGTDLEWAAGWEALKDLYAMPEELREQVAGAFPDVAGCGPSSRETEPPGMAGSVTMTVESPVTRAWQAPTTCHDNSQDGKIDMVWAELDEDGQKLDFYLNPAEEPPILEVDLSGGTTIGYIATTQDRSLVAEALAADGTSGSMRFSGLAPNLQGGFLQPTNSPIDGRLEWTCTD